MESLSLLLFNSTHVAAVTAMAAKSDILHRPALFVWMDLHLAQRLRAGVPIRDRMYHMTVYESCFVGIEAVDWFLAAGVCHKREVAVALGQKLLEAHFFHHVVDGHRFEDKPFFYRFYVDEDKKYKRFWKVRTDGPVPVRWRFQPHTSNNSGLLSLPICEGVQHSFMRADHAAFMHYLREMRALARQRTAEEGGWRISKSRSEEDITTFVQLDDVETIDRQVKCVTVLPLTAAIVARTLLPLSTRPEWDGNQAGPGLLLQELSSLCVCPPGDDCACSRPPPLTGTPPSSLTLDDTGYDSDSDEELLHERVARFISRSSFLSHVFKGVVKRTEESMQYLSIDSLPRLPELEEPLFPRIVYRQLRPVAKLASTRDVVTLQDYTTFPDGAHLLYEVSVQHSLVPPSSSCRRAEVLGLSYLIEPVTLPTHTTPNACRLTVFAHVSYKGRSSRFVEDAILTKNSISAVSRIRRALLPSVGTDGETFEGIPMSDGNPVPTVQASGDDTADRSKSSPAVPAATARSDVSPASPRVSLADFEILAVIGRGGYGKVFQVRRKGSSEIYAMKSLKKKDIIARKQASRTMVERNILSSIYHPYIVSLKYAFQSSRKLFMVMDFVSGGDFFSMLSREGAVSETRARLYTAELLLALEHLHGMGIVYRDLKPENVLLDGEGHVKLTDFGLSRFTVKRQSSGLRLEEEEDGSVPSAAASSAPDPSTVISHSFCGTEQYMAPEVLLQKGHSAGVDFWSLGILLSEMMTGRHPFRGPNHHATLKNIVSPIVPPATIGMVSRPAGEFMLGLLTKSPLDRLGTDAKGGYPAIKAHAFFRGLDWSAVAAKAVKPEHVPLIAGSEDISNFDKVFTREAPVFSEVSTGGEGRGPTAAQAATGGGGMFGGLFRKGERPTARPQSSIDDSHFRQFSYISPEFLDKQPKQGGVSEQARE